jgi:hypothetical protein
MYEVTSGISSSPSVNVASVTYIAKVDGVEVAKKVFSLTKMKSSSIYKISPSANSLIYDTTLLTYSPTSLTFNAQVKSGNNPYSAYPGKIEIQGSSDGSSWSTISSADNTTSNSISVNNSTVPLTTKFVRGVLSLAGTSSVVDTQTVPLLQTAKGSKGDEGKKGLRGIAVLTWAVAFDSSASPATIATACQAALTNAYPVTETSPIDNQTPRAGDRVTLFNQSAKYSKTYLYNGSGWGEVALYVDGSAVVTGTISTSALAIGNTSGANRILLTDSQILVYGSSSSLPRVIIGNLAI